MRWGVDLAASEPNLPASRGRGRPTLYTEELADEIAEAVANSEEGLHRLCDAIDHFPDKTTVYRWQDEREDFRAKLTRARETQGENLIYGGLRILDETDIDTRLIDENGDVRKDAVDPRSTSARVTLSKAQAEYRMRMAGKIAPRKYGDKLGLDHSTPNGPLSLKATAIAVNEANYTAEEKAMLQKLAHKALEAPKQEQGAIQEQAVIDVEAVPAEVGANE